MADALHPALPDTYRFRTFDPALSDCDSPVGPETLLQLEFGKAANFFISIRISNEFRIKNFFRKWENFDNLYPRFPKDATASSTIEIPEVVLRKSYVWDGMLSYRFAVLNDFAILTVKFYGGEVPF